MAVPASFAESNDHLSRPEGLTDDQCEALSVWRGDNGGGLPVVVSCWKLTAQELAEINRTGRVWLHIVGKTMPPAAVTGVSPFVQELLEEKISQ